MKTLQIALEILLWSLVVNGNQNFNFCVCDCDSELEDSNAGNPIVDVHSVLKECTMECLEHPIAMKLMCDDKKCNTSFSIDNCNSGCANQIATFMIANDCQMCDSKHCLQSSRAITTTATYTTMLAPTVTQDTTSRVVTEPSQSTTISVLGAMVGLLVVVLAVVTTGWVWTCWTMKKRRGMKINPTRVRQMGRNDSNEELDLQQVPQQTLPYENIPPLPSDIDGAKLELLLEETEHDYDVLHREHIYRTISESEKEVGLQTTHRVRENEEESYSKLELTGRNNLPHNSVSTEGAREECEHSEQGMLTGGSSTLRTATVDTDESHSSGKQESSKEREDTDENDTEHVYCQLEDCGQGNAQVELERNPAYAT